MLLLTDVDAVYENWSSDRAEPIRKAAPEKLRAMSLAAGSMAPKVAAACRFVEAGGHDRGRRNRVACIGALDDTEAIPRNEAGTRTMSA
ncbi:MAG: hypothetical protein GY910_04250 [bacterium]|nr:hypothetical protein [bacterium]